MIKLIKSTFHNEEDTKNKLADFIKTAGQLSFSSECQKFEENFAKYQGRKHCIFFNSGSSANLALIQALNNTNIIRRGDRVGFSAVTWATNVMPLLQLGMDVCPVDIELNTLNISANKLSDSIRDNKIKVLFLTNLLGFCGDVDKIKDVCNKNNIILIEDNCESLGTVYKGKKLGNFGLAGTFSFFVGHHMSTIEGGAVCTDDDDLAMQLRMIRAHGWDRSLDGKQKSELMNKHKIDSEFYSRYTFYDLGYNLRPTEISGFLGNNQLQYIDEIIKKRESNFKKIAECIYQDEERFIPIKFDHIDLVSNFAVPILCKTEKIKDELIKKCDGKIEIRPIVGGDMTQQPFFKKYNKNSNFSCPNADFAHKNGFYFGNNQELTAEEIAQIKNIFV